jgi:hypothetical protein
LSAFVSFCATFVFAGLLASQPILPQHPPFKMRPPKLFSGLGQLLSHLPRYPQTKKLKTMNFDLNTPNCPITSRGASI